MAKWKIQSNFIAGVGKVYRAARTVREDEPLHSGNVEVYGQWCEDYDAVEATVNHLNEQENLETIRTCVCPICGKRFVPTPDWHWTSGKFKFCRYHCYLKRHLLEKPKSYRNERCVRQFSLTGEIIATYKNAAEAAQAIKYPVSTIRACCNERQSLGTGYRWEYVGEEALTDEKKKDAGAAEKDS